MQHGVYLNTQSPPDGRDLPRVYDELLETVQVAERAGFDFCFIPEHHQQPDGYLPSPFVIAGAIAASTTRIGIATGVHILPLWDPMRSAEDSAVVDVLSRGRFMPGVGLGMVEREFHQFGITLKTAVSRFEEQIEVMRQAWSDVPVTFSGKHFSYDAVDVHPKPVQKDMPLMIGGMSERAVARAGRLGDGWLTDPLHSFTSLQNWAKLYRETAAASGRPAKIWMQRDCWITEDPDETVDVWAPHLVEDWQFYFRLGLFSSGRFNPRAEAWIGEVASAEDITYEMLADDRVLAGSPEQVQVSLDSAVSKLDPDGVALRFRYPSGPSHEATLRAVRLFGERIIARR